MAQSNPSFMRRLTLACSSFVSILSRPDFAAQVERLSAGGAAPAPATPAPVSPAPPVMHEAPHESALQLLGLLQREARFVDFVQEDVATYSDADIGAAARVVHEGCRKVLREHFTIEPVSSEPEGSRITLHEGFNAGAIRLTGNVVGQPPFTGSLGHRGWRVTDTRLPKLAEGHDAAIVAQAEVEL
jgi:uncharacterized protein DUF2760